MFFFTVRVIYSISQLVDFDMACCIQEHAYEVPFASIKMEWNGMEGAQTCLKF